MSSRCCQTTEYLKHRNFLFSQTPEWHRCMQGCMYNCATATADSQRLYASSSDGKIKELEEVAGTGMQIITEFNTGCAILQLVLPPGVIPIWARSYHSCNHFRKLNLQDGKCSRTCCRRRSYAMDLRVKTILSGLWTCSGGKTLYAGTDTGCIRAYKLPLSGEQQEVRCFSGAVTRLRLSHDDSLLYATSADGSLFVFEVKERDPLRSMAKRCIFLLQTSHLPPSTCHP